MITPKHRNGIIHHSMETLPCARCLHDTAFASGMVGGARCPLIERAAIEAAVPPEWHCDGDGGWTCESFASAGDSAESGNDDDGWAFEAGISVSAH